MLADVSRPTPNISNALHPVLSSLRRKAKRRRIVRQSKSRKADRIVRIFKGICAALGIATLVTTTSATAQAATAVAPQDHCVLNVDTNDMRCYTSFTEAQQPQINAPVGLGTWYDLINHNPAGGTLRFVQSRACTPSTSDTDYSDSDLTVGGWNNRVSSLTTESNCDFKLFDLPNYRGTATGWIDRSLNLGAMSNKATSYKIS